MTDLHARLRAWFDNPAARRLAKAAPSVLLAGGVGATLGVVVGLPTFAASGQSIVLGGIAVNLTSSIIQELLLVGDDDQRAEIVQRGLDAHDPDVTTLAAAALVHAGPELAQALPAPQRDDLIAGLERAMREAGGSLDAITQGYAAALRDPRADWAALQNELRQTIADTRMLMEVGDEGVIAGGKQWVEDPAGRVDMTMRGGDRARLENVEQIVTNTRPQPAVSAMTCPDCGASVREGQPTCTRCGLPLSGDGVNSGIVGQSISQQRAPSHEFAAISDASGEEIGFKRLLLREKQRRLEKLELQNARKGHDTEPEILTELEDLKKEIEELKKQM
jgi:hypothetical protein